MDAAISPLRNREGTFRCRRSALRTRTATMGLPPISPASASADGAPGEGPPEEDWEEEPLGRRATAAQRAALQALADSLRCALCSGVARAPVSLGCGHFFCRACIDEYSEDHWECPVCGISVSMSRSDGRSFIQTDPQLETMVQSLADIQAALRVAPEEWWTYDTSEDAPATVQGAEPSGSSEKAGGLNRSSNE